MMTEAYVESRLRDGTTWRWVLQPDGTGVLPVSGIDRPYPLFVMTCGDRIRQAMVTPEVQQSPRLRKSVYQNMAMWDTDAGEEPELRIYVKGKMGFADGTRHRGLCLMILTLDGKMAGGFPVPLVEL
jgi:hypothetical protein